MGEWAIVTVPNVLATRYAADDLARMAADMQQLVGQFTY